MRFRVWRWRMVLPCVSSTWGYGGFVAKYWEEAVISNQLPSRHLFSLHLPLRRAVLIAGNSLPPSGDAAQCLSVYLQPWRFDSNSPGWPRARYGACGAVRDGGERAALMCCLPNKENCCWNWKTIPEHHGTNSKGKIAAGVGWWWPECVPGPAAGRAVCSAPVIAPGSAALWLLEQHRWLRALRAGCQTGIMAPCLSL